MKSTKCFRIVALACALLYLVMSTSASAALVTTVQPSSETYTAKAAYITNVDQYGHQTITVAIPLI